MELGVALVTQQHPDWQAVQLPLLRAMRADVARVVVAPGFGNDPSMLAQLAAAGVKTVVLNSESTAYDQWTKTTPTMLEKAQRDLDGHGWVAAAKAAGLTPVVELGNEPDRYDANVGNPAAQVTDVTQTAAWLHQRFPGIVVAMSLPTTMNYARALAAAVPKVDALAPHLYGGDHLGDGAAGEEAAVLAWAHDAYGLPLYLTEIGIANPAVPMEVRAQRILDDLGALDVARVRAACVFTISDDPAWRTADADYWLTDAAAAVFAGRSAQWAGGTVPPTPPAPVKPRTAAEAFLPILPFAETPSRVFFPQTRHSLANGFKAFWETHGGLAIFGLPISEEFQENGIDVQYTERARLELHPGSNAAEFNVELGLVGDEAARARGYMR